MRKSVLFLVLWIVSLSAELRTFYPPIEPNQTGFLDVEGGHSIYWEESGNPQGKPILFIHGGPGIGSSPSHRTFFNPAYRIILFDQRGCGKSVPFSGLENNTTWDLVRDIEALRKHLNVDKWVVFGGSWGSTLGLTYAIKHPDRVEGMILRGIFLCRPKEIQWYYQAGAHWIFPDFWEQYVAPIPL
ncbi:MAG TPA: alpha/beta fold hydrolase, partial [Rhabdochlamydiaceae bacterium]